MLQNDTLKLPTFHFDPDPAFNFDADPDPAFHMMRIRILLFTLMRIRIQLSTLIRIRIQLSTLMRIRMRNQLPKMMRIHVDLESSISMFTYTNLGLVEIIRVKTVIAVFEPMMCNSFRN
jgi:hypothetical protein